MALKALAKRLLHDSGAVDGLRFLNRRGIRILMYHHFTPDVEGLKRQCEHIRRYYHPVSLTEISDSLRAKRTLPPNALAVTIDDGYRDYLLYGHPLFREYEIPTTVYLVSDFLDGKLWLWWNQIEYALQHTEQKSLTLQLPREGALTISFETDEQRESACLKITESMKGLENSERLKLLKLIPELLEVTTPHSPPAAWEPLKWDEVRELSRHGVEFGAHTRTHPILSSIKDREHLRDEIEGSKRRLEEVLGQPIIHFCYPNGRRSDFNEATLEILRGCGFHSATTTERGMNYAGAHPFLLRRLGVEPALPDHYFQELLAGVRRE